MFLHYRKLAYGKQELSPANPEICDGLDNNGDGSVDEDLTRQTTCGAGACTGNTGTETCTAILLLESAIILKVVLQNIILQNGWHYVLMPTVL
ncbi:MAG TPA: hypothetical protein ENH45_02880 [Nitrospirae bacterium]|nr:hypothetical protein BMS3Abin10_02052 [bacterium BMS3Abin10]GBE38014.1 hypothetical protein BMS3Bbin08_00613 [bacterium BMS3Bbin08]HDH00242.1 hypothetical protein [Nitrospirota bacterium]HDH50034.1 hypothetical protein [Nitrospirota bacterium]HDZ84139.1 hypothetical protein [Nitrospirota bacterium]